MALPVQDFCDRRRSSQALGEPGHETRFVIYQRRRLDDQGGFSRRVSFLPPCGRALPPARSNGPSHEHGVIAYHPHIHRASERAIVAGKKPECYAEQADRFASLEDALACLISDFNLTGFAAQHDQQRLF